MVAAHGQIGGDEPGGNHQTAPPAPIAKPQIVRISSGVMQGLLLKNVDPIYPLAARSQGLQVMVVLHTIIGKDGHVEKVEAVSGPDEFRRAATDAVGHWVYKPYLLNGEPVEVDTTVVVNFNLNR